METNNILGAFYGGVWQTVFQKQNKNFSNQDSVQNNNENHGKKVFSQIISFSNTIS